MDINTIREHYDNGEYTVRISPSSIRTLPDDYVFDENKSIKQNRAMVIEHNTHIKELKQHWRDEQNKLYKQLTEDVVDYITDNYNISKKQAYIIESFVYQEKHAFMSDYFNAIDTFAELVEEILNITDR